MKRKILIIIASIAIFLAGALISHYQFASKKSPPAASERKILYWVAPMDANYRRDKPGKSPMGMDLVPVYADEMNQAGDTKISPAVENNLGVKTAEVKSMDLSRVINTVGSVTVDENNIENIHTYTDGWIKNLYVKTTGELVKKGQLLFDLYSPALNNAQSEFLLALKNTNPTLIRAARSKLMTLGMNDSQINELEKTRKVIERVNIYANKDGVISQLDVREGKFVQPNVDLVTIEGLSYVWVIAEVFERQAAWVAVGQPASATFPYMPGKDWQGEVEYVYPQLDPITHTLRVRLRFPNPDFTIKPNMYASVRILGEKFKDALAIPRSALIRTGSGDRVVLALADGHFRSQPVTVGIESGDYYQVLSGLKLDEKVVTRAQFLIDSESSVEAEFERMEGQSND